MTDHSFSFPAFLRNSGFLALLLALPLVPGTVSASDIKNGARIYSTHCSSCHGVRGRSSTPGVEDFSRQRTLYKPNHQLVQVIERGSGIMPAYRGLLSTDDILDVIAHMRTFK